MHAYERSVRVFDNQPNDCGPVHIVIGDGGNREVSCVLQTVLACTVLAQLVCISPVPVQACDEHCDTLNLRSCTC